MPISAVHLATLTPADRALVEQWLLDFDRSWHPSRLSEQVSALPPLGSPLRTAALVELVKIDLERRWQAGAPKAVTDYLSEFPELSDDPTVMQQLTQTADDIRRSLGTDPPSRRSSQVDSRRSQGTEVSPPPARIGRYRIECELGRGGMGAVYLAHDTQLDRRVALKLPNRSSPELTERFFREARAAALLQHPNVCPVHDVGEIDGQPYLAMAYIEGKSLAEFTRPGNLPSSRLTAHLVATIARALAVAHEKGIIHRDLKPSNVMIRPDEQPVIMDFGLARRLGQDDPKLTLEGAALGTPAYMPPEQVNGEEVGPTADVYSLGVLLYELLTGSVPFEGHNLLQVFGQILMTEPERPSVRRPEVDPGLEAVCLRALRKQPEERFASMTAFADALEAWGRSQQPGPALHDRRRSWLISIAVAVLFTTVLLAGVVITIRLRSGKVVLKDVPNDAEVLVDGDKVQVTHRGKELDVTVQPTPLEQAPAVAAPTESSPAPRLLTRQGGRITDLVFTADSRRLVSASNGDHHEIRGNTRYHVPGKDNTVRVWDLASSRAVREFPMSEGFRYGPLAVDLSSDGRLLAAASSWWTPNGPSEPRVYVWDLSTGALRYHWFLAAEGTPDRWAPIRTVGFTPDGKRIISVRSGMGGIIWWTLPEGQSSPRISLRDIQPGVYFHPPFCLSPDRRLVYADLFGAEGEFCSRDTATGEVVQVFKGHSRTVRIGLSSDGNQVLSGSDDFSLRSWEAKTARQLWSVSNLDHAVTALTFSPDGRRCLTGASDGLVQMRDAATGKELARWTSHTAAVQSVAIAPDNRQAASGDADGKIFLWSLPDSQR